MFWSHFCIFLTWTYQVLPKGTVAGRELKEVIEQKKMAVNSERYDEAVWIGFQSLIESQIESNNDISWYIIIWYSYDMICRFEKNRYGSLTFAPWWMGWIKNACQEMNQSFVLLPLRTLGFVDFQLKTCRIWCDVFEQVEP